MNVEQLTRWGENSRRVLRRIVFPQGSLRARFAKGAFWSLIGVGVSQGSNLVASTITARVLGVVGFGQFGILNNTIGTFGLFAGLGLGVTATKYVAELRKQDPVRSGKIIGLSNLVAFLSGGLSSLLLIVFASAAAENLLNSITLTDELRIASLILFLSTLNGVQTGILSGFESFKTIAFINLIQGLARLPLVVAGVWLWGLTGAIFALVLLTAMTWILGQVAIRRECQRADIKVSYSDLSPELPTLWEFSLPAFLSSIMYGPGMWVANIILVNAPTGYAEMGIYSAANQWRSFLLMFPNTLSLAILPMLSSLYGLGHKSSARKLLLASTEITALGSIPFAILVIFFREQIMSLYGQDFGARGLVLALIAIASMFLAVQSPAGQAIAAAGRMWLVFTLDAVWAVILIAVSLYLVGHGWGADGIALATLLAFFVHGILDLAVIVSLFKERFDLGLESAIPPNPNAGMLE